jgi:glycerol-3-phosphate dehydrogenase
MKRDLVGLARRRYDVAIIGGGIYGVCAAWEASRRGMSVCLLDKGDFGAATSANSLRIMHGGLRYLQHLDIRRLRESARERLMLQRFAPHLTRIIPFVLPTYGHGLRGPEVMGVAMGLYHLLTRDLEGSGGGGIRMPRGRVVSRDECLQQIPGVDTGGLTGAAIWYETVAHNTERVLLTLLRDATRAGAAAANYTNVTKLLVKGTVVHGVCARDERTGQTFEVEARLVLNAAGPWANTVLPMSGGRPLRPVATFAKALNLVTPQLFPDRAIAIPFRSAFRDDDAVLNKGVRHFFVVPWGDHSLVGTRHLPWNGSPEDFAIGEQDVEQFVGEISAAYPAAPLRRDQVVCALGGMVPVAPDRQGPEVQQLKHALIVDHLQRDGIDGLMSVVGVKWTTARRVAEEAVRQGARKLGFRMERGRDPGSLTASGRALDLEGYEASAVRARPSRVSEATLRHLVRTYGVDHGDILSLVAQEPALGEAVVPESPVLRAEIVHAVREEMAQRLTDVLLRRTTLGIAYHPGERAVRACAELMTSELGWSQEQAERELAEASDALRRRHANVVATRTTEGGTWQHLRS